MNMSAAVSVWIALKPAYFTIHPFIFKFITSVGEDCFFELNEETSWEIDKVRK